MANKHDASTPRTPGRLRRLMADVRALIGADSRTAERIGGVRRDIAALAAELHALKAGVEALSAQTTQLRDGTYKRFEAVRSDIDSVAQQATALAESSKERAIGFRNHVGAVERSVGSLQAVVKDLTRETRERLLQYHLQLGRLTRIAEARGDRARDVPRLSGRTIPFEVPAEEPLPWTPVGGGVAHPDPEGREWVSLDRCPLCDGTERTIVCPWNKLLLVAKGPDQISARYDYAMCHACGVVSASRRPIGERYRFMLEHFGEVTAKAGGDSDVANRLLNPYALSDDDRDELRTLAAPGVFVSDHLRTREYLGGLFRDRFENLGHVDVIASHIPLDRARVLEVRSRTGAMLDAFRRYFNADVYAMPIWESQQFLLSEVYQLPTSALIDFDAFSIPFDQPFDLIVLHHMFTHVLHPRAFFAEIRRHLKPGGHIYLHNDPDDAEFLKGKQSMVATLNPLHMQAFDSQSLRRGLAAVGFEVIFQKRHEDTHICLARMADVGFEPMDDRARQARLGAYERALQRSLLRLDPEVRSRIASEWSEIVAGAVASGAAEFDDDGRMRLSTED